MKKIILLIVIFVSTTITVTAQVELITNGDFSSTSNWTISGSFWYISNSFTCYSSATGYAYVGTSTGGGANSTFGSIYQQIFIPSNASSASLKFKFSINTDETASSSSNDLLEVQLRSPSQTLLHTLITLSNLNGVSPSTACQQPYQQSPTITIPQSYFGQNILLNFQTASNASLATRFRIDDVSLTYNTSVSTGNVHCVIEPSGAVNAGAKWNLDGDSWNNSDETLTDITVGSHTINYKTTSGWTSPNSQNITVSNSSTYEAIGTYTQSTQTGDVTVTINPSQVTSNARWNLDGIGSYSSGFTLTSVSVGNHTVNYNAVSGWDTPPSENITVTSGGSYSATGNYTVLTAPTINSLIGTNVILNHSGITPNFTFYEDYNPYNNNPAIKICADGSDATYLKINASNTDGLTFRLLDENSNIVLEGTTSTDMDKYGKFGSFYPVGSNQIEVKYTHPIYMDYIGVTRPCSLQILYNGNSIGVSYPFNIYRAPVLFVHGWLGDSQTFAKMESEFWQNNIYEWPLTHRHDYSYANDQSFAYNINVVQEGINDLFIKARNEHFSFGKANVIAHSMGGVLSRLYLQSSNYKNDINELITLNTPHSGTQGANFLYDLACVGPSIYNYVLNGDISCPLNGLDALQNMKVNSDATRELLNGNRLNYHIVPSFAISTEDDFATDDDCGSAAIFLYSGSQAVLTYAFLQSIFNFEENDLVVPLSSQRGGLTKYMHFNNQCHLKSAKNDDIILFVSQLMNAKPTSDNFDVDGFNPPMLNSIYPRPLDAGQILSGSLNFTSPLDGAVYLPGEQVSIQTVGSSNIQKTVTAVGNRFIPVFAKDTLSSITASTYTIPETAIGEIRFISVGYDTLNGMIAFDTLKIKINVNAVLDSIRSYKQILRIPLNSNMPLNISGYFSDGIIRDLSLVDSVSFSIGDTLICRRLDKNVFNGVAVGNTILNITYRNQSIQVPIEVYIEENIVSTIFSANKKSACLGEQITFSDLSLGQEISRNWQFPGGTPASSIDSNPIVVYNTIGNYDVMLITTYIGKIDTLLIPNFIKVSLRNKTITSGNWNDPAIWSCGYVPSDQDSVTISSANNVSINSSVRIRKLNIESGATINISDTLTDFRIGTDLDKSAPVICNGKLNITSGLMRINGALDITASGQFNMNNGSLIIDGNTGDVSSSIADGQNLFNINCAQNNFIFSGGTLQFINPPLGATSQTINCNYNFGPSSTLVMGDGVSTIPSNNPNGFGGNQLPRIIGKFVFDPVTDDNNRLFINLDSLTITDTCIIKSGRLIQTAILQVLDSASLPNNVNHSQGLIAWYPFTGNAIDSSGNGNNGTVNGAILTTDRFGRTNQAYGFNGSTDFIEVPHSSSLDFGTTTTFAMWIKTSDTLPPGKEYYFFAKHSLNDLSAPSGMSGIHACVSTIPYPYPIIFFRYDRATDGHQWVWGNVPMQPDWNVWTHVVIVIGENGDSLYVNGMLKNTSSKPPTTIIGSNTTPMYLGKDVVGWNINTDAAFKGKIDDIKIYNRALNAEEIIALYHENGY